MLHSVIYPLDVVLDHDENPASNYIIDDVSLRSAVRHEV